MAFQSGQDISVQLKLENVSYGVKPLVVTGATRVRLTAGGGLHFGQAPIEDPEIRNDGEESTPELGSHSVNGSYISPLSYGGLHDLAPEAALRGTWAVDTPTAGTDRLVPGVPKIERSYTVEEQEQTIDGSSLYTGCRFSGFTWRLTPNGKVLVEYPMVGSTMEIVTGASSPYFTSPVATTTRSMSSPSAAIEVDGVPVLEFTAAEITVTNNAAGMDLVGTKLTPNVWTDNLRVSGSITALRSSFVRQQAWLAGTNFSLAITASDALGNMYILTVPMGLFMDYTKNLGASGAMLATMPFRGGKDEAGTPAASVYLDRIAA